MYITLKIQLIYNILLQYLKVMKIPTLISTKFFIFALLCFLFVQEIKPIAVPPVWITSSYIQADSYKVINGDNCSCKTGNASTPTAIMTFRNAFTSTPNLGYGISSYQGDDHLGAQMFQVNRTGLTPTFFSVLVKISGYTNIWVLEIRYIVISKQFPHHLNSFDNVPVNYTFGPLVNISSPGVLKTFTNVINYTIEASLIGSNYTHFSQPLQNNRILLFLTSLFHSGTNQPIGSTIENPIRLYINANPISTTTYQFYVELGVKSAISRLHFSMIIFDQADVQSSGKYLLIYDKISYPATGGFYPFPSEFVANFMVGFSQFSTLKTRNIIHFENSFVAVNGSYGIEMPHSQPRPIGQPPIARFCYTFFYIKTWYCPIATFYDDFAQMCISCPIINCLNCLNISYCQACDKNNGYFINISSGQCNPSTTVNAEFLSIEKSGCNSFKIISRVPEFTLSQISKNIFILNEGVKITTKEQNGTQILIYAEYNRDIAGQTIMLQFSPMEIFNITYNPTIPALYYSPQQCQIQGSVETMLKAAQIISYTILIISLLSCKIVGLQLFGVLQLSYFTLSSHNFLNVYLAPLTKFKTFNGLNIQISPQSTELPDSIQKMNLSSSFINNCNVMLIVLFGQILISFITYLASKIAKNDKLKTVSLRLLKQGFVTLILFNIFNISFSAGVHWKYASPNDDNYIISTLILVGTLLAAVVSVLAMELTAKEDYGQFKNKFKQNWVCRFYVPLTVIYRMALGFYSAVKSDYDYGSLLVMAFSLAFIMYTIVNLPFLNVFQNYRCCLVHVTMLYTLLTTNYYRGMKSTTPMEIKGRIYTPAIIELVLMMSCIALSFLVLVYEIYQIIKLCRKKRKTETKTEIRHQPNLTQQSFENIN